MSKGLNFTNFLNSSEWTYTHIYMKRVMNSDKMEMGKYILKCYMANG